MIEKQQRQQALVDWINQSTAFRCQNIEMVSGDASFRRYFRFADRGKSVIAVDAPPEHEDSSKFVNIAQAYEAAGVPVPQIFAHNPTQGFYLQEDFGDAQFADALSRQSMTALYTQALSFLPQIQNCKTVNGNALPYFDSKLLNAELYLFTHWLVEVHLQLKLEQWEVEQINQVYDLLKGVFVEQPQVGVHRDYHCRNLMIRKDNQIGIIDFQDAVIGPLCYDAVSLLRDCYQDWPEEDIEAILVNFHQRYYADIEWLKFKRWFDLTGVQRHIKASGIFCRLCHRDGKQSYLKDIPHTLGYIVKVGQRYTELQAFANWLDTVIVPKMQASLA